MTGALNLHPKVAAPLLSSWVTAIIIYSLHQWAHTDLTATAAVGVTGTVALVAGWIAPNYVDASSIDTMPEGYNTSVQPPPVTTP